MYTIFIPSAGDYDKLITIWESSVTATHHFLRKEDIAVFKQLILGQYFDMVNLYAAKDTHGETVGFIGVSGNGLEMLFIDPLLQGRGIAGFLLKYALKELGVTKVDVNEQNTNAREFYEHAGFKVISRSELDGTGKPYPVLHLAR